MKRNEITAMVVVGIFLLLPTFSMAKQKKYITLEAQSYLQCQPVEGYSGKVKGKTGRKGVWKLIKMEPAAKWNKDADGFCLEEESNLLLNQAGEPIANKVCGNPVIDSKKIGNAVNDVSAQKTGVARIESSVAQKTCDEGIFSGRVTAAVLRARPAGSAAIEMHFRTGKAQPYKAKRGHVKTDGKFYPEVQPDGSCMVKRSVNSITNVEMMKLLRYGETLSQLMEEDGITPFTDKGGDHNTTAVYVIDDISGGGTPTSTAGRLVVAQQNPIEQGESVVKSIKSVKPLVFQKALPFGNQ